MSQQNVPGETHYITTEELRSAADQLLALPKEELEAKLAEIPPISPEAEAELEASLRLAEQINIVKGNVHLLRHNLKGICQSEDPKFPCKLILHYRLPSLSDVATKMLFAKETLIFEGTTKEVLETFSEIHEFTKHPRFISQEISEKPCK